MPHIHTQPNHHDMSVTGVIIRTDGDEPRTLLHMHRKLGTLMPVGGHVELDETPWAGMAHELEEESGYRLDELDVLQPKLRLKEVREIVIHPQPFLTNSHYIPNDHFHSDLDYLFIAHGEPKHLQQDGESVDLRWLTRAELTALPETEIMANIRDILEYIFEQLLVSDEWELVPANSFRTDKISR